MDAEFNEFAIEQAKDIGTILFGRKTYELMASYWPTESAKKDDSIVAGLMNSTPKTVFSRTLEKAEWNNTRLVKGDVAEEVSKLKQRSGRDVAIFGSSDLAVGLAKHGLIDEFRIMVIPVVLGGGKRLFEGIKDKLNLKLVKTRSFKSGNILLYYEPGKKAA